MKRLALSISLIVVAGCNAGSGAKQEEALEQKEAPSVEPAPDPVEPAAAEEVDPVDKVAGASYSGEPELRREFKNGLVTEDFVLGKGPEATVGARLSVRYAGILDDGTILDDNRGAKYPHFRFHLPERPHIQGWGLGLRGMKVGGKRKITVPPHLGYGSEGDPGDEDVPAVPKNARITYVVELVALEPPPPEPKSPDAFRGTVQSSKKLRSGLVTKDYRLGEGESAEPGDRLSLHYRGYLPDGSIFDQSVAGSSPFQFILGDRMLIPGWNQGLAGMRAGGLREVFIPAKLAYGKKGTKGVPPSTPLRFTFELVALDKAASAQGVAAK